MPQSHTNFLLLHERLSQHLQFKAPCIYYLRVLVDQKSGHSLWTLLFWVPQGYNQGVSQTALFQKLGFSSKLKGLLAELSCLTDMEVCLIQINRRISVLSFSFFFFLNEVQLIYSVVNLYFQGTPWIRSGLQGMK